MALEKITEIFGVIPKNESLYNTALTHPSFIKLSEKPYNECYERLEFVGDAVLKLLISEVLFELYPDYTEGKMSKIRSIIVSDNLIARIAKQKGLNDIIILAQHEEKQGCRDLNSICACAFEAVLGACYLDGHYSELKEFVKKEFSNYIAEVDKRFENYNAKEVLQEYTQKETGRTPDYTLIDESGPDHNKVFVIEVSYHDAVLGVGKGSTKKEAEQNAARSACKKLGLI